MNRKIFIAGSGGIGEAAAILIREWADFETEIFLGDINEDKSSKRRKNLFCKIPKNIENRNGFDVGGRNQRTNEGGF